MGRIELINSQTYKNQGTNSSVEDEDDECKVYKVWSLNSLDERFQEYVIDPIYIFNDQAKIDPEILKRGLSVALGYYTIFAGRMNPFNPGQVILNDKGIEYIYNEEMDTEIETIIENETDESNNRFIYPCKSLQNIMQGNESLLKVKLTKVKNGHLFSVWACHAVCDGSAFYKFMQDWSKICDDLAFSGKVSFIPDVCLDQTKLPYHGYARRPLPVIEKIMNKFEYVRGSANDIRKAKFYLYVYEGLTLFNSERHKPIRFTWDTLKRLKHYAEMDAKKYGVNSLTTNEAFCSFLCQMMGSLFEFEKGTLMRHATMLNMRTRYADLPSSFIGNASTPVTSCAFHHGDSIGQIAAKMHDKFLVYKTSTPEFEEMVHLITDMFHYGIRAGECPPSTLPFFSVSPTACATNSFSIYPIYEVSFGTGSSPVKVIPHHSLDQMTIWPAPDNQGLDIYFQGVTSKRIKRLPNNSIWFEELFKYSATSILAKTTDAVFAASDESEIINVENDKGIVRSNLSPFVVRSLNSSAISSNMKTIKIAAAVGIGIAISSTIIAKLIKSSSH